MVYLDDIAVYGDEQAQVLEDTLEVIRRLTKAGFMINLKKSNLVEDSAKVLGHYWLRGGFWAPNVNKLAALIEKFGSILTCMKHDPLLYRYWVIMV